MMTLYGVYGSHTVDACPMNNEKNKKLTLDIASNFEKNAITAGVKIVAQFHSSLEHTWLWVFEATDASIIEELMIKGDMAKFNSCTIVPLLSFTQLAERLKATENS